MTMNTIKMKWKIECEKVLMCKKLIKISIPVIDFIVSKVRHSKAILK